jgi:transposase InsO family protein
LPTKWVSDLCRLYFKPSEKLLLANTADTTTSELLHQRLAHINSDYITKTVANTKGVRLISTNSQRDACEPCLLGKLHRDIGQNSISNTTRVLELIHTDILGPFIPSLNQKRYIISFIDDYSRSIWVYPITAKSESIDKLKELYHKLESNLGLKIARIRSDNAKELNSDKWTSFTKEKGIINEYTSPYSPELNGIAERFNRTLLEKARTVITAKNIPFILWPYIFEAVAYIINRTYSKPVNSTPYEILLGSKPDISNIRVLGSLIYRVLPKKDSKLDQVS